MPGGGWLLWERRQGSCAHGSGYSTEGQSRCSRGASSQSVDGGGVRAGQGELQGEKQRGRWCADRTGRAPGKKAKREVVCGPHRESSREKSIEGGGVRPGQGELQGEKQRA